VFGTLMRREATLPNPPTLPPQVAERWREARGEEVAAAAARLIAVPPPLDLIGEVPEDLEGISLMPGHLRLARGHAVAGLTGFGEGRWWVQDISAAIPARLLGPGEGKIALDLCAAPGGKTMQLATAGFQVSAVDSSAVRLERMQENLARTGLKARIFSANVMHWRPEAPADAILLDAPCSATGIYRRHPDVLHRVRPRAIAEMAETQKAMLARAAQWLKPGGTLVYSVCSLEPEEGEAVAAHFLAANPEFETSAIAAHELPAGLAPGPEGWLRILPGAFEEQGGADSFFIARIRRR
jgi:16S rRNA (cytosine967-C5)-methyltransferase